jgi:hypothetical protein
MVGRGNNFKQVPLNIAGSSTFGRYYKISHEKTVNMLISDGALVDYAGYMSVPFMPLGSIGRGLFTSTKLGGMIAVVSNSVWLLNVFYDNSTDATFDETATPLNPDLPLSTNSGVVYITETDSPQIVISDGVHIYVYDPNQTPSFYIATSDGTLPINFTPGYIDFQNTYVLVAASNDMTYTPPANNTWRISTYTDTGKLIFPPFLDGVNYVGLLTTKADNTQAVLRFPSKGNMALVMGSVVSELWFNYGTSDFPYQRNTQMNVDYGCLNPATIARMDEIVVWLAQNEKSGPIIMYTNGGPPEKITTDGIDYLFSQLLDPSDSQGFIYRQDGHLIYHINFYTDNLSLFYDFNTQKFFHATDEDGNYFMAAEVAFFNNQYYFVTKNNGLVYAFDTIYTTYDGAPIPRERICSHTRDPSQKYFIANDVGFTIEQGENNPTPNQIANIVIVDGGSGYTGAATLQFVGGNGYGAIASVGLSTGQITSIYITNPGSGYTVAPTVNIVGDGTGATATATVSGGNVVAITITNPGVNYTVPPTISFTGVGTNAAAMATVSYQQISSVTITNPGTGYTYPPEILITGNGTGANLIATLTGSSARIDLSVSRDGGQIFGTDYPYVLNPNGVRMNRLTWWNIGLANDIIFRFRFYASGRFVAYDGEINIRI